MNTRHTLLVVACAALIAGGCASKSPVKPQEPPAPENTMMITEDVVESATGDLAPTTSNAGQYTFDLGGVTIVSSGQFDDFQILYQTSTSCDTDVNVFNVNTQEYDAVGINPGGTCLSVIRNWERLTSERKLKATDYLNGSDQLIVEGGNATKIRVLDLNSKYNAIPFLPENASGRGIDIVGGVLWIAGNGNFHRYTMAGTPQPDVPAGTNSWVCMAFDGENFWTSNDGRVFSFSPQGVEQCRFNTPGTSPNGIAFLNNRLWLAYSGKLEEVNPTTSCLNGSAQVEGTVSHPVSDVTGLATDGTNFYIASATDLTVMTIAGAVLNTYPFPVESVAGVAYSNGGVWVIHNGPKNAKTTSQFVSRFLLP